jgi:hypothetical protein
MVQYAASGGVRSILDVHSETAGVQFAGTGGPIRSVMGKNNGMTRPLRRSVWFYASSCSVAQESLLVLASYSLEFFLK